MALALTQLFHLGECVQHTSGHYCRVGILEPRSPRDCGARRRAADVDAAGPAHVATTHVIALTPVDWLVVLTVTIPALVGQMVKAVAAT
jgi:hypothetical protein